MSEGQKLGYQKTWHIQVPGLKLIDFTRDRRGIITLDKDNELRLFDQNGKELWHRSAGYELISISLADTLEVLAVDAEKHSILYGPEGTTMWRKRPFPAVLGKISASGEYFSFVTTDPAIIGTDRALRVKWAYRNLMKKPADLAISGGGQTVVFPCSDDRGDGVTGVNQYGKPYDPFMGMKTVLAIDVSEDGQTVLALDDGGAIFCVNPVRGYGVWKGKNSPRNTGVSYAGQTGDSVVYSDQGRIVKFDPKGNLIWEYSFTERLLKAFICPDSHAIYYATERGEVGCLQKNSGEVFNQLEFMEKELPERKHDNYLVFRKIWNVELFGNRESPPMVCPWQGHEGVEYCLVWNGKDRFICLNDVGEEVWQNRIGETKVSAISVSADADIAIASTSSGIIGFDIDGNESFRFFGSFCDAHVYDEGAIFLIDEKNEPRFYLSPDHFSHIIPSDEKSVRIIPFSESTVLVREKSLAIVDSAGNVTSETSFKTEITFADVTAKTGCLLIGESSGEMHIVGPDLKSIFKYKLGESVGLIGFSAKENIVFASVKEKPEIFVLRPRSNELLKNHLTGNPVLAVEHESGMIIGTDMDQLGLIGMDGGLIGRYTYPDRIVRLVACKRPSCFILLSDDALSCVAAVENTRGPDRKAD